MVRAHHQGDFLLIQMLEGEAAHHLRLGHAADHEIHLPQPQLGEQIAIRPGDDARLQAQILRREIRRRAGEDSRRDGGQRADGKGRRLVLLHLRHGAHALLQRREAGPGIAVKQLAEAGELQCAARTVEQFDPENLLQLRDGFGQSGLGEAQAFRCVDNTGKAHNLQKNAKVAELDAGVQRFALQVWHITSRL